MEDPLSTPIRILTHNIRYATTSPFPGEEPWSIRCPLLCSSLFFNTINPPTTFICLQEVLNSQLTDILYYLNNSTRPCEKTDREWAYIGVGRDDGQTAGEYSPILYHPSIWKLVRFRTYWMSDSPGQPPADGKPSWGAGSIRICTVGIFELRSTGQRLIVMNTHLDDQSSESRSKSAKLLLRIVDREEDLRAFNDFIEVGKERAVIPVILAGDMNSTPEQEAYQTLTAEDSSLEDVELKIPKDLRYGNELTFTSFGTVDDTPAKLDFIFLNNKGEGKGLLEPKTFAVLPNKFDDGVYISDHRPVVADLILKAAATTATEQS